MMAHRLQPGGDRRILIVCDHASSDVPDGVELGVPADALASHIALDIGAGALALALGRLLDAPAILGRWSRLVADANRPPDHPDMIPEASDGVVIPGNRGLSPKERAARLALHRAFHAAIDGQIASDRPLLIVSLHSFTPALASNPAPRPWPVALLWNRDDRAVRPAHESLLQEGDLGGPIGLNEPYSGQLLNYTMDRHAEVRGIAYLGFEVRQDMLADEAGIVRWAAILLRSVQATRAELAALA